MRMGDKNAQGRPDHRFPSYLAVLLGQIATGTKAPPARDDDSRNPSRHWHQLLHVLPHRFRACAATAGVSA
jgi:hypothetical protein